MVGSVSANIITVPPDPMVVAPGDVTINDKTIIVGDINIDPSSVPTDQFSLNGGTVIGDITINE
jgi:hypothetical protein